jgi:hypothetical protein
VNVQSSRTQTIDAWEQRFSTAINALSRTERTSPGGLLWVVPPRDEWDSFTTSVRAVWRGWEIVFSRCPAVLVILYDGIAFYRYESGNFWQGFAEVVGVQSIGANEQSRINQLYQLSASKFGLSVRCGEYNSAAIRQIGVPISMWEGVLEICEWALWTSNWQGLSDQDWKDAITRRLRGRRRLIDFLTDNREAATKFIREMLDARGSLREEPSWTLFDLENVCCLRNEYFEEVPETADFLREDDPESLLADRARLSWDESRDTLSLYLPPVEQKMLPAHWRLGGQVWPASGTAEERIINFAAFTRAIRLELCRDESIASQRIAGIGDWALWDEARSRFISRRDQLPLAQYTLISRRPLCPKLEGWAHDPEDPCTDLLRELTDGTPYYITRLVPASRHPKLKIGDGQCLTFTQRRGVTLRLFCGKNPMTAARAGVSSAQTLCVEDWPRPFLEVPLSLVADEEIAGEFAVFLDNQPARGRWVTYDFEPDGTDETNADRSLCFWQWDNPPIFLPSSEMSVHPSFDRQSCGSLIPNTQWLGRHTLHVQSRRLGHVPFGGRPHLEFEMLPVAERVKWPSNWGLYLTWILLSQVQDEASWEEVRFASEAVAMWANVNLNSVYYAIRKLERHDYLAIRGHRYVNFRNRIMLSPAVAGEFTATYCGLSTALYGLVRAVPPTVLEVPRADAGRPPTLRLNWAARDRGEVSAACEQNKIQVVNSLW